MGSRCGARGIHSWRAREQNVFAAPQSSRERERHKQHQRSSFQRNHRRRSDALGSCAGHLHPGSALPLAGNGFRQRHERPRAFHSSADEQGHRAGSRGGDRGQIFSANRRTLWPFVRGGSCAWRTHGGGPRFARCRPRGRTSGRVRRAVVPAVYERRCSRRRTRRRNEKRDGHCSGRLPGAGTGFERPCSVDHARPRGNGPLSRGAGRTA